MPQIFKLGSYTVFFWSSEGEPLEPVHVHIARKAGSNATKIWITSNGRCFLCHNNSHIPERILRDMMRVIEARSGEIVKKWYAYFGQVDFYC